MKPPVSPFTAVYTEWLGSLRALLPGGSRPARADEPTRREAQAAADQEWEDEGGSIKPAKKPAAQAALKLPL